METLYPWQEPQWRRLISQHQQNRLPHALLITGQTGLGQLEFAEQWAQYLFCEKRTETACGQCRSCRWMVAGTHPDLWRVTPEEAGKNIKIDQIREMQRGLHQTAQRAGYQIALIAPADALNKAAANALLKILEEPPGKVLLLLISHQPGALPATVVSRCQQWPLTASEAVSRRWLAARLQTLGLPANADQLLKIAEYAPLCALELAQNHYLTARDQLLAHCLAVHQGKATSLAPVTEYLKQGVKIWVDLLFSITADLLRLHLKVKADLLVNQDSLPQLQRLAFAYPITHWLNVLTALTQARQALLNHQIHLNEQLLLESLLIFM
jgi:DNA polymerase III subunit delta'